MGYLVFGGCAAFVKSEFIRTFAAVCCGLRPWFAVQVRKNETKKKRGGVVGLGALFLSKKVVSLRRSWFGRAKKPPTANTQKARQKTAFFAFFVVNLLQYCRAVGANLFIGGYLRVFLHFLT